MNDFPKGSEWRKWDLHIHTPGTKKNDQYRFDGGDIWGEFCDKLESSDVEAFGITDYFSSDGYFNFIEQFRGKYPNSRKIFFPNVELCTSDVVNAASEEVNLHIIFNPFAAHYEQNVKSFLQHLDTNKTGPGGRHVKASELSTRADFEEATTTRESIKKALHETYGDKTDLTDHLLVFTAANNDGIRTANEEVGGRRRGVRRKAIITDEVDKFSHGFFGNSGNIEHFLRADRLEDHSEMIDPKPVVSGSDAHSFSDLDAWVGKLVLADGHLLKTPTWIKADLTFEGLKQILYEPAGRIFIGEEPEIEIRVRGNQRRYINSICINQIGNYSGRCGTWFQDERIEFNKELVAIIGNKGSGKSALTDMIGLLGNSHNQKYASNGRTEELFSFLNKEKFLKNRCASNFSAELNWYAGEPDCRALDAIVDENSPQNVEYLPQKYLEKICANIEDDEFRQKLNEVIFGYIADNKKYGKTNLEELIRYLSNQTEEDIKIARIRLHQENQNVIELERKLSQDHKIEIEQKIRLKRADIDAHKSVRPPEVPKPTDGGEAAVQSTAEIAGIETQLQSLAEKIEQLNTEQIEVSRQVEDLRQARQTIERQAKALSDLKPKYQELLNAAGMVFEDLVKLSVDFEKLDEVIEARVARLSEIATLVRDEEEINLFEVEATQRETALGASLSCQKSKLEKRKNEIIDQLDKPNREYQAYLRDKTKWEFHEKELVGDDESPVPETLNWFQNELNAIVNTYPRNLEVARVERDRVSREVFSKRKSMVSFYDSVKQSIDQEIDKYSDDLGNYEIYIEASLRFDSLFYDEFFKYINQAVRGSFQGKEEGATRLKGIIEDVSNWQSEDDVFSGLGPIVECLHFDKGDADSPRDIFKQMKSQRDPVDLYDYIFGFDYLKTKYDLKVDEKDLSELSPGERGGLLLIFYLMLDRRDIPLIIDQPEDNLDNKSVYEILVTFLKKAKKRRQIIMATHNPNLAVVADAEQIIHVSIDKKNGNDFDFYAGAIEDSEINKRAVDILEGTLPAFDNRRLKYRKQ